MPSKCSYCGKFLTPVEGAKCAKCSCVYHPLCVNISPNSNISAKWQCPTCKKKQGNAKVMLCSPVPEQTFGSRPDASASNEALVEQIQLLRQEIKEEMGFVRADLGRVHEITAAFGSRMDSVEERLAVLELNSQTVETRDYSESIALLRTEINEREQINLLNDLEIIGLKEKENENILNLVHGTAQKIGVNLTDYDVVSARRLGRPKSTEDVRVRSRPIVVRLTRRCVRDELLQAARMRRIDSAGIVDGEPFKLYLNEHLTPTNRYLMFKTREEARNRGYRFIWTRNGKIFIRHSADAPINCIRSESDFVTVFNMEMDNHT